MQNGVTPLHVASHYDNQAVALMLLDKQASPHATAKNGHTPLHIAAKKNQVIYICKYLLFLNKSKYRRIFKDLHFKY